MPTKFHRAKLRGTFFTLVVVLVVLVAGADVHASPTLAKQPTHLISVGARSFRCQCDPTAVDLNFAGECRRPSASDDTPQVAAACSAFADNCACTEISHLVRRGGCLSIPRNERADEREAFRKAMHEIDSTLGRSTSDDLPLFTHTFLPGRVKADPTGDALFFKMQQALGMPKVDPIAKRKSIAKTMAELSPRINEAIVTGCNSLGKCEFFSVSENRAVEILGRGANGDFQVELKATSAPYDSDGVYTTGIVETELRTIFGEGDSGFTLQEKLGQGSFGIVFKATAADGSEVAIKFVRTDRYEEMYHELAFNNEMLHLFANTQYESLFLLPQGLLKIKRPLQDDQLAFIYEKMDGDIAAYMRSGSPRDFSFLRSLGSTVFNGARVMEKHGLIHRDIKLENVLYIQAKGDQPASMRLADFGLSLRLEDLKRSGKPQGTLGYGAPEMLFDNTQSPKTDAWAAGVTLYTAATGNHPFGKFPANLDDIFMGLHRLLGQGTLPKQYADKLGTLPKPVPLKEFLAKTITRNEEVQLSTVKRSQLAELLERIFVADPAKRISLESAANHPFITSPDV